MRTGIPFLQLALNVAGLATTQPTIPTYAGGGPVTGPALSMNVNPLGMAVTAQGDVYFTSWHAVYKLSGGIAILIAGTPQARGFGGDGGLATSAALGAPSGVAVDGSGNLYIVDGGNYRIRKVSAETNVISTVAGIGSYGYGGDGGPATSASLTNPKGVAVGCQGKHLHCRER